jgi:hypothetical protein
MEPENVPEEPTKVVDKAKLLKMLKDELEQFNNPSTYMSSEYYIECRAKADVIEDIIFSVTYNF